MFQVHLEGTSGHCATESTSSRSYRDVALNRSSSSSRMVDGRLASSRRTTLTRSQENLVNSGSDVVGVSTPPSPTTDLCSSLSLSPRFAPRADYSPTLRPHMSDNAFTTTTSTRSSSTTSTSRSLSIGGRFEHRHGEDHSVDDVLGDSNSTERVFFSGNPSVEVLKGKIHLYRNASANISDLSGVSTLPEKRSTSICVLAVPSYITVPQFCKWIAAYESGVEHVRIVRDRSPNKYMVLLLFRSQPFADEFFLGMNGRKFHSLETEVCSLLFVETVKICDEDTKSKGRSETNKEAENGEEADAEGAGDGGDDNAAGTSAKAGRFFPPPKAVELPTCPVCLERMDPRLSGVVTSMCNHQAHGSCVSSWNSDGSCPVCRFLFRPTTEGSVCAVCGCTDSLWICLVCGTVGCGRYKDAHARLHFEETQHTYSMYLEDGRVWDYAGDGYVHRLAKKSDGGMVELPHPDRGHSGKKSHEEKEEFFDAVLGSCLDEQRRYYDERMKKAEESFHNEVQRVQEECQINVRLADKRVAAALSKLTKNAKDLSFLQQINKSLEGNQDGFKEQEQKLLATIAEKDQEILSLQEQVRDLMAHFGAAKTIEESALKGELQEGAVLAGDPPLKRSSRRRNNR